MADDDLYVYYMPDDENDTRAFSSHKPPDKSAHDLSNHAILGVGLENLGNTCFMNSVLQCIIHTVPLLQPILSTQSANNCNKKQFCLLSALRDLIFQCLVSNATVSPVDLVNNLTYISSNFKRSQQEDAHEFFQCFLDRLGSCHEWGSIVQRVFGGRLVSNLMCCNCGHCSDTYEPSIDLSLEIDDADNLFTALYSFTKVERIGDLQTKFTCQKCKERVYVDKKLSFDQPPQVALLHLKRFINYGSFVQKIDKHVVFPLDLDLQPFTRRANHNHVSEDLEYVLYAVVVHVGLSPTSGHYYCYIRLSAGIWFCFDDSKVELVDEEYVLSQEAYLLFYAKKSTPWFSSFIETQKEYLYSTTWHTSPVSVLDNSMSPYLDNRFSVSWNTGRGRIKDIGVRNETKGIVCIAPHQKQSPVMFEKANYKKEVSVPQKSPIDIEAILRSPSPEIYTKDSTDADISSDMQVSAFLAASEECRLSLRQKTIGGGYG
ncbi:ubiquitin carboxyl-terminal hydrolase 21-like [Salvia splendens]|uniref:ubiquitin carboxyl-terminal hydrolase 21-like n=1 Tax=Salvia splendens TaxID=180675 RepID=UPI001C252384|nr:ubiquitin carboxyl-terminal hydrolase 21-like [Salvia splendens]